MKTLRSILLVSGCLAVISVRASTDNVCPNDPVLADESDHAPDSALIIYEHKFIIEPIVKTQEKEKSPKPMYVTLKFILVSVHHEKSQIAIFQNIDPNCPSSRPQAGKNWYWSRYNANVATATEPVSQKDSKPAAVNQDSAATTPNVVQGLAITSGDRIVLKDQSPSTEGGVPVSAAPESEPLPPPTPTANNAAKQAVSEATPHLSTAPSFIYRAYADDVDLTKAPFNLKKISPYDTDGKTATFRAENYALARRWVLTYYAANNDTPQGRSGDEVLGGAILCRILHRNKTTGCVGETGDQAGGWVKFVPLYLSDDKDTDTVTHSFDPLSLQKAFKVETDVPALVNAFCGLFGQQDEGPRKDVWKPKPPKADICQLDTPTGAAEAKDMHDGIAAPGHEVSEKESPLQTFCSYTIESGQFPQIDADSTGVSLNSGFTVASDDESWPQLDLSGGKYFDHPYYNVSLSPSEKVGIAKVGANLVQKVQPQGTSTKTTTSADATIQFQGTDGNFSWVYDQSGGISIESENASNGQVVDTDEYSGTSYGQQVWNDYPKFHDIVAQYDLSEWVKPAEATQESNFYTAAAARYHSGVDIPVTDAEAGKKNAFLRIDSSLTGGGVLGVAPAVDRMYGGNTSAASANDIPGPVVRSFGTGKLGVFPRGNGGTKTTGALSYANFSLTIAFPLPFLSFPFLNKDQSTTVEQGFDAGTQANPGSSWLIPMDPPAQNQIDYIAYYNDEFSLKPVFTCDAAWLGAPTGYSDRTLGSIGGGVELSVSVINLDILYEVTLHDTASREQPLSDNIIAQLTYDLHF